MKRALVFMLLIILFSVNVSASCEEGQIDINSASLEELDELYGIGPVKAQAIIDYRDDNEKFEILEDLLNVSGIGEITLENMKSNTPSPCIDKNGEVYDEEIPEKINESEDEEKEVIEIVKSNLTNKASSNTKEIIKLNFDEENSKDIKTNTNTELSEVKGSPEKYSLYVFLAFCVLIVGLYLSRRIRRKENEFR